MLEDDINSTSIITEKNLIHINCIQNILKEYRSYCGR